MNKKFEAAQDRFLEGIGRISDILGINRSVIQLYTLLYLSPKSLSLDEIVENLKVSKGNVSVNIRQLEKWGAVKNIWVKGSRKDYYQVNLDIKKIFLANIKSAVQSRVLELSNLVEEFEQGISLGGDTPDKESEKDSCFYRERLDKIKEIQDMLTNSINLLSQFVK